VTAVTHVPLAEAEEIRREYGHLRLLSARTAGLKNLQVLQMVMRPGTSTRTHHHASEEAFVVLRGSAAFETGGQTIVCQAYDTVSLAPHQAHRIINRSESEECEILIALSPPRDAAAVVYVDDVRE
jgi:quercetin dioxygenase-like cupin family protein